MSLLRSFLRRLKSAIKCLLREPDPKMALKKYGDHTYVPASCKITGAQNVSLGNDVHLGEDTRILTTRAQVILGNHIMFGPGVTIITGDHRTDILGKYMTHVTDADKLPENDQDVVLEDDVWIGANVTILKGVTIGRGSIIAAGSVVTKSCPPYSIVGGVPGRVIKARFTQEEIQQHEAMLAGQ